MNLYERIQNPHEPSVVVAELAWSHDGDIEKAKRIIAGAADAKADVFNFHLTDMDDYMHPLYAGGDGVLSQSNDPALRSDVFKYLEKINLTSGQIEQAVKFAREKGLKISTQCNDTASLNFAHEKLNPDIVVIHPSALCDTNFVAKAAVTQRTLILYCGGLSLGEIEAAIRVCHTADNRQIILKYGMQSYPTQISDNNLNRVKGLMQLFGYPMAFGDHTDAEDPMAFSIPLLALPLGVRVLVKHVTWDRTEKGEDFESALNPQEFRQFVSAVRSAETALGQSSWQGLTPQEEKYRLVVRKRAVANQDIPAGGTLQKEYVTYMRSDAGFYPEEDRVLAGNAVLRKPVKKGEPITWDHFK